MLTLSQAQEILEKEISNISFTEKPKELYEPINYILSIGGKRLRPALLLLANDMFGGKIEEAINPAIAIEVFHNFTLLHDDIMDNANLRRNQPTVNARWGDNIAILSGDAMFIKSYQYLINTKSSKINQIIPVFNQTALQVCEGQQIDMNFETNIDVSIEEYLEMIALKTSVLLGASLKIGAIIGNASESEAQHIYDFGLNMGLGFQLQDDLLDVYGDPMLFGKEVGKDIVFNKKTYLLIKALELANGETLESLKKWTSIIDFDSNEKVKAVTDIFNLLHIREITIDALNRYFENALNHLEKISIADSKKLELRNFCNQLKERKY